VLARAMAGLGQLWRIARRCRQMTAAPVLSLAAELARELGVTRPVLLLHGLLDGPPAMPMTWGFRRPIVLLPTGFAGWPEHRQRAVLLHELAHVKRGDWLAQMLAQVTCAVYWFHPLAWWAAGRLRVESERACDDRVLSAGVRASDYATQLLEVVRTMKATRVSLRAAVMMAQRPLIEERLRAILDGRRSRCTLPRRACALAVAGAGALLLPIAAIRVAAKTPPARMLATPGRAAAVVVTAGLPALASVEITPRKELPVAHIPSAEINPADRVPVEPQPAAPSPAPEPAPVPRPEAGEPLPVSDPAPVPRPVESAPAEAKALIHSAESRSATVQKEECRQENRAQRTVLAFSGEIHQNVVLASAVTAGDVFFAADVDDNRSEGKVKEPNLEDKDLSGADLSGRDLSGKDLSGKDLSGANLSGAKLREVNLSKTDLSGANLTNVDLSHARAKGADMSGVNLTGANLSGVDLSGVDLSGANLSRVNSRDLTLAHADLSGANLKGIELAGRDLSGADFSGADLSGARLSNANLTKADLSGANLGDADLSHARLKDADLSGANLNGTNVRDADLSGADVSGTKLDKTKPE
jgi:uncharacterized protein YjbI with pentapeptide repeats